MRSGWRILIVTVALAGICLAADPSKASGQRKLPALQVADSAGAVVNIGELGNAGNWLLFYVHAKNPASVALLKHLKADKFGAYSGQLVILVGGLNPDELSNWSKQFPDLSGARWLADPQRSAMRTLDLHGVPVELGLKDNSIEWQFSGAMHENEMFESTLLNWLKQTN